MAEKRYLLTPGPTPVPPEVLAELAKPVIHHRERDFREIYERCLLRLQEVYRTKNDVLMFTTSGTGAFESAVANLTSPGDRQLVLSAGNFGERWAGMAKAFGADLVHVRLEWGETPEPEDLRSALADAGDVRVVYLTHSETSTGVVCDVQALTAVAKEAGALVVVDAVSSLGAVPLETDAWGIDGVDATEIVAGLRDRFGITIANGQGDLKGKIFRIGHIGWFDVFDITTALAAVELTLADAGAEIERGLAVTRALEAWAEHTPV